MPLILKSVVIWRWSTKTRGPGRRNSSLCSGSKAKNPHLCNKNQQPRLNEILLCEWPYFLCYFSGVCSFFWFDKLNSDDPDTLQYDVVPVIVSSRMFLSSTANPALFALLLWAQCPQPLFAGLCVLEVLLTASHFIAQKTFILLQLSLEWVFNCRRVKLRHNIYNIYNISKGFIFFITPVLSNVSWQNAS